MKLGCWNVCWFCLLLAVAACDRGKAALPDRPPETSPPAAADAKVAAVKAADVAANPLQLEAPPAATGEVRADRAALKDVRLSGTVTAPRTSALAFRVNGFIAVAPVKPGQIVKAGEVLAELDRTDYELRVKMATIRRDQAKVAVRIAEDDFKREQQLSKANATTATVFQKISAAFEAAGLALQLAETDLQIAVKALEDTKLVAPYDCVVARQLKFEGEQVGGGGGSNTVFEVYDTAQPEISLSAPEALMGKINLGDELKLTIPAIQYSETGKVIRLVGAISAATRTFQVVAQFIPNDERVVPGHFAEAEFK